MIHHHPDWRARLRDEFTEWRPWVTRGIVLAFAAAAGLSVAFLTWLSEHAYHLFQRVESVGWWAPLLWTPLVTAAVVWVTRRYFAGAAGSGIQHVMAAMETEVRHTQRSMFVSLRLSIGKIFLTATGLLGGLSLGREGPSVQIAAGVLHSARRWLPERGSVNEHGLLVAGGAAGIAAAFNTPLGGVMFAIEELSRRPEERSSGLLVAAIVLAGLMSVSIYGNATYFGIIEVPELNLSLVAPGLLVALVCGVAGGIFSRLLIVSSIGGSDRFSRWRARAPVRFAAGCGLAVAVIGLVTHGNVFGSGYSQTRALLDGDQGTVPMYTLLKGVATWITTWSGVPGGLFAPSLAIGAGIGSDLASLLGYAERPALIALGMTGFLAAVTQAPLTSFIIVMEMVAGQSMVLSLMACALIASLLSRLISAPLYSALMRAQLLRIAAPTVEEAEKKKGAE
ncbi:MAG: chloride channel protein [Rubrivivax sp.]|nr:chloride channel protein [Rubrivivax sp.]